MERIGTDLFPGSSRKFLKMEKLFFFFVLLMAGHELWKATSYRTIAQIRNNIMVYKEDSNPQEAMNLLWYTIIVVLLDLVEWIVILIGMFTSWWPFFAVVVLLSLMIRSTNWRVKVIDSFVCFLLFLYVFVDRYFHYELMDFYYSLFS